MSESTLAIDHAWSVLKGDEVEKAAFLAPVFFGGLGGATGSGARLGYMEKDPDSFFGYRPVYDPGFHADAAVYDPITGAVKVKELGDSPMDRAVGFGAGALQAVNPMTYIGAGGKLVSGAGRSIRGVGRGGEQAGRVKAATRALPLEQRMTAGARQAAGKGVQGVGNRAQTFANSGLGRFAGRGMQAVGNAYTHFGPGAAAMFGAGLGNMVGLLGGDEQDDGFGMQGQTQGFGSGGLGINDISNVQSNAVADRQIWNPDAYRSDARAVGFEGQQEFGGFGKGENMFVNNTGEEIRKQVEEMMNKAKCAGCTKPECMGKMTCPYGQGGEMTAKAKCAKCGKADCVGKMGCGMAKAEDKKKPAHGMVIVIGSKAGPGPSKEGKREKLDSEKKEE